MGNWLTSSRIHHVPGWTRLFGPALAAAEPHEGERYERMTTAEKRSLYKCGDHYVTLEKVKSWSQYHKRQRSRLLKNAKEVRGRNVTTSYPVRTDLNEKVSLWKGDITTLEIDAIVNAANNSLMGGGGVDGAIHTAAGASLLRDECRPLKGCDTGDAKITSGYKLPARYIIHTVGPIGDSGKSESKLRSCYSTCLKHMVGEKQLKSIAFPCISTGIYGYPNDSAAIVALETTRKWLESNADAVDRVIFCLFLPIDVALYEKYMLSYFPVDEPGGGEKSLPATEKVEAPTEDKQVTDKEAKAVNEAKKPTKESGDDKETPPVNGAKMDSKTEETGGEDVKESCEVSSNNKGAAEEGGMDVEPPTDDETLKTKEESVEATDKKTSKTSTEEKSKGAAEEGEMEVEPPTDGETLKTEEESVEATDKKNSKTSTEELSKGDAEEEGMEVKPPTDGETLKTKEESSNVEPTDKKMTETSTEELSTDAPGKPAEEEAMHTEIQHETKTNETSGNEDTKTTVDTKDCDEENMETDEPESASKLADYKRDPIRPEEESPKSAKTSAQTPAFEQSAL